VHSARKFRGVPPQAYSNRFDVAVDWHKPWCQFVLSKQGVNVIATRDRHWRGQAHVRRGLEYEQCGHPATHEVDGVLYCERHAGSVALQLIIAASRA
jgi:hypothetical protein